MTVFEDSNTASGRDSSAAWCPGMPPPGPGGGVAGPRRGVGLDRLSVLPIISADTDTDISAQI